VLPISFFERAGRAYFNSIAILDADGTNLGVYRKSHIPNGPGSTRLWIATTDPGDDLLGALERHGRPIRYRYVPDDWPLDAYSSVFALDHTSAEMPMIRGRGIRTPR